MDSEVKWLQQRIDLLRTHLQELKHHLLSQRKAYQELRAEHQKQGVASKEDPLLLAQLTTQQARQLTALSINFTTERGEMLARHKQDELDQNQRINLERGSKDD